MPEYTTWGPGASIGALSLVQQLGKSVLKSPSHVRFLVRLTYLELPRRDLSIYHFEKKCHILASGKSLA